MTKRIPKSQKLVAEAVNIKFSNEMMNYGFTLATINLSELTMVTNYQRPAVGHIIRDWGIMIAFCLCHSVHYTAL